MGNRRSTKSERTGARATGGSPHKSALAKPAPQPGRPDSELPPKLYEKPPQDLIDFVAQRTVYIEAQPLKKRPKGKR